MTSTVSQHKIAMPMINEHYTFELKNEEEQ